MERKKITFDSFIRGVILGVIIIGILMLFKRLSGVLLPFFIAWLIAYLIYPLVTFFQYRLRLKNRVISCLLYTSDAADEEDSVDLGGRRIIKKIFFSSRRRHTR